MIGIYKITSPNNYIYIGQSWDIDDRLRRYRTSPSTFQRFIYRSIKKYGWGNHKFEIIEELDKCISQDGLDERETYWWRYYKEKGNLMMNIREPGSRGRHSKETKRRMSLSAKGIPMKEESKEKLRKLPQNNRGVVMLTLDGKYIKEFRNLQTTAEYMGTIGSYIGLVVAGKKKTCKGYTFLWKDDYEKGNIKKLAAGDTTEINQYDLEGNFIKSFLSVKRAEESVGIKGANSNISACCKGRKKSAYGYIWKHKKLKNYDRR